MPTESTIAMLSALGRRKHGVFRGRDAVQLGVTRAQLARMRRAGAIVREHPDTFRMAAVAASSETALAAALLWAGDAVGGGRSAGEVYGLEGVRPRRPEIVVPGALRARNSRIVVRHARNRDALMVRTHRGFRVTGVEATLVALAASLDGEAFEIACEDARRRRLTSVAALHAYLDRFGKRGMPGVAATRQLLDELDPVHPSKSTLEVKMRRLLVADGCTDFVREFPLTWNGRTRFYDFAFTGPRVILETNGRRWHDDPNDYEDDQEKWSIPGRLGYRLVFATYDKVTQRPDDLLRELTATLAA